MMDSSFIKGEIIVRKVFERYLTFEFSFHHGQHVAVEYSTHFLG